MGNCGGGDEEATTLRRLGHTPRACFARTRPFRRGRKWAEVVSPSPWLSYRGGGGESRRRSTAPPPRAYPACLLRSHAPLSSGTKGAEGGRSRAAPEWIAPLR